MILRLFSSLLLIISVKVNGNLTLSQESDVFWDEETPFGQTAPSPNLRLPQDVVPSFYRLKIEADLENSTFTGEVSITIKASKRVKEIILHSKNLSINSNAKLTEQIYEKVEMLHTKTKRAAGEEPTANLETGNATQPQDTVKPEEAAKPKDAEKALDATIPNNAEKPDKNSISENITKLETASKPDNETNTPENIAENGNATVAPDRNGDVLANATTQKPIVTTTPTTHTQVTHSSVRNIKIISITEAAGDRLVLTLASALKPDVDYTLELSFGGIISNSLTGFYKSTYMNNNHEVKQLGVTQFEPTSARAAFPCFDEPAFKAKFEISIAHKENITALSNMNVATQEPIPEHPGWQWTHFERSVKMSTYLVAYILSDFKSVETSYKSKSNITKIIRIWTRPELISKAQYALTITPKLLKYYEQVFGVEYALDKLDLVAIPDFSSGAMENWGLITFRETTLLFDETNSVPRDKQNVAIDIAHELAHQWFGNLVTMRWWTDLWLNEGFATYIEYVGVDHIEPEWNMIASFSRDKMDLLRSDALKNTSPVSQRVIDASEIWQKFDEISYAKGANLIRMLNHTITENLFHSGLLAYLNKWKYENAEENDLWQAMSTAAEPMLEGRSLVEFMNTWTRQPGYPVVNVKRDYVTGSVQFDQRLFTSSKEPYKNMVDQLWQIPISYVAIDSPESEFTAKPKLWLTEKSKAHSIPYNATQALYVNVDAIGYYRVNYDRKNWELLGEALKSGQVKSPITKSQLIDDAFNLAKSSQLNYSDALELTTCVIQGEESKTVWELLLNNMAFLKYNLKATPGYVYFQDYMKILLRKQLQRLNYGLDKPKDDVEAFLIENLVAWECDVEARRCLEWARGQFDTWAAMPDRTNNTIPSYLRSLVYNMALKHGGRREFDLLWNMFQNSTDPNVKSIIITNLPSTREEYLVSMLLEKSLTEIPKQYAVAAWSVEPPIGTKLAQKFLLENFDRVYRKFTEMDAFMFPSVLNGAFGFITSEEELDKLKSFALAHKEKLLPMSQTLRKIVDTATLRIDWMKKHAAEINQWLENYVTRNTTATSPNTTNTIDAPADPAAPSDPATATPVDPADPADHTAPTNSTTPADPAPVPAVNETKPLQTPTNAPKAPEAPSNATQEKPIR